MKLLGLDFDNTLVRYDKLFHKLALEKDLIDPSVPTEKTAIRDHLRSKGQDEIFTLLQGEVYGLRILEAEPAEGMLEAIKTLQQLGVPMALVSHKTNTPYKGPAFDLHKAAWSWLEEKEFFAPDGLGWERESVFFETTKESKVERIEKLKCSHYIDDLPEILQMLPKKISKILYDPHNRSARSKDWVNMNAWSDAKRMII